MTPEPRYRLQREAAFFDAVAMNSQPEETPPAPASPWVSALLDLAGDVRGKSVLELGCGAGDLGLRLLAAGA